MCFYSTIVPLRLFCAITPCPTLFPIGGGASLVIVFIICAVPLSLGSFSPFPMLLLVFRVFPASSIGLTFLPVSALSSLMLKLNRSIAFFSTTLGFSCSTDLGNTDVTSPPPYCVAYPASSPSPARTSNCDVSKPDCDAVGELAGPVSVFLNDSGSPTV